MIRPSTYQVNSGMFLYGWCNFFHKLTDNWDAKRLVVIRVAALGGVKSGAHSFVKQVHSNATVQ